VLFLILIPIGQFAFRQVEVVVVGNVYLVSIALGELCLLLSDFFLIHEIVREWSLLVLLHHDRIQV